MADALWQSLGGSSSRKSDSSNVHYELSGSIDDDNLDLLVREGNARAVKNCLISTRVDPDQRDEVCASYYPTYWRLKRRGVAE